MKTQYIGPHGRLIRHIRRAWPNGSRKRRALQLLHRMRKVTFWAEVRLLLNGEELKGVGNITYANLPIGVCERAWTEET